MKKVLFAVLTTIGFGGTIYSQNTLPTSGKVGIGTLSPTEKLTVMGGVKIDSTLTVDSVVVKNGARVNGSFFVEGKTTLNNKLYLPGIATATSLQNLYIVTTNTASGANGDVQKIDINAVIGEMYKPRLCVTDVNGNTLSPAWQNGTNKLFTNCASVGIGTDSPRSKLDVRGTTSTDGLAIGVDPSLASAKFHFKTLISTSSSNTVFLIENLTGGKLMQLNNQGFLKVRDVRVDLEAWPDYVFEKDYKLMPLSEVEAFIKQNGHLPNVPSAKVVETEGLSVGEMNKVLMEKIEQLTLYIIEQEKQNQQQNVIIQELKTQFSNNK